MTISSEDRSKLISLARSAVGAAVSRESDPAAQSDESEGILAEHRGCFVTLTNAGRLRGCIGTFHPDKPLGKMITEMGLAAANDSRFLADPITPGELDELSIEVSVLSPLELSADPQNLRVGTDGIYIIAPAGSGCFLPEVATDQGWNAQEFLQYCCRHKAGLPQDAWKDTQTKIYLFTSEKFAE